MTRKERDGHQGILDFEHNVVSCNNVHKREITKMKIISSCPIS